MVEQAAHNRLVVGSNPTGPTLKIQKKIKQNCKMKNKLAAKYFDGKLSKGFSSLFINKAITNTAVGLFGVFMPIFLFEAYGHSLEKTILYYYLPSAFVYGYLVAFGAKKLNGFGFRKALRLSVFLQAAFFGLLVFVNSDDILLLTPVLLFLITFWRLLYWIPYHIDFAKFSNSKNRARQVGIIDSALNIIGIITPLVAGLVISRYGFNMLFVFGIMLYLLSFIPLLKIPHTREKFSWSYQETWRKFLSKEHRRTVLAFCADGAENAVGAVVWPIFIFVLLNGNYLKIGEITALIVAVTVVLELVLGKRLDKKLSKQQMLKYGSVFYSLGWIVKIFIATAFHVFVVDAYHKLTKIFLRIPFESIMYETAADQGHYVDEFTVLHEMAISFGRSAMYFLVVILSFFVSINWVFVLAALASIGLTFLRSHHVHRA